MPNSPSALVVGQPVQYGALAAVPAVIAAITAGDGANDLSRFTRTTFPPGLKPASVTNAQILAHSSNGSLPVLVGGTSAAIINPVIATASLPAAGATNDGLVVIEDAGAGDRNLIVYAGGQRFRIDGGAPF